MEKKSKRDIPVRLCFIEQKPPKALMGEFKSLTECEKPQQKRKRLRASASGFTRETQERIEAHSAPLCQQSFHTTITEADVRQSWEGLAVLHTHTLTHQHTHTNASTQLYFQESEWGLSTLHHLTLIQTQHSTGNKSTVN